MKIFWFGVLLSGVIAVAPTQSVQSFPASSMPILSAQTTSPDPFSLMKSEALGELKLDLSDTTVIAQLGQPSSQGKRSYWGADGLYHQKWQYQTQGILLDMTSQTVEGNQTLNSITITTPSRLLSRRGIGIGMTRSQVEQAYGAEENPAEAANSSWFIAGSAHGGLMFKFQNDRVIRIFLGAGAE